MSGQSWAIVLAGGDGIRLRPLTRRLFGDERPKQFCPIINGETLIASTRARLAQIVTPDRTLFVVVRAHRSYYARELQDVPASRLVVQPANKGTSAAIIGSLLRNFRLDEDAIVGFFPTDHHYADEKAFASATQKAYDLARRCPRSLVLMTADPTSPEADYGWIEPQPRAGNRLSHRLYRVNRFCEKPSPQFAQNMLERGCLWNTFVMVGRARTFLEILENTIPEMLQQFAPVAKASTPDQESESMDSIYRTLDVGDFSRQVLTKCTHRLIALRAPGTGWSDLGDPDRVTAAMARTASRQYIRGMDAGAEAA